MNEKQRYYTIILRHDTSTNWAVNNPILVLGEYGVEDDTHRVKRGDGTSKWTELPYETFGLEYIVSYENLSGDISDNEQLTQAFEEKVSKEIFSDVNNSIITGINVISEDGSIAKITRTVKNIDINLTTNNSLIITSKDHSLQGEWSIDQSGIRVLNLQAVSVILDYDKNHTYHKYELCFYNNNLYRAARDFESGEEINLSDWELVSGGDASKIIYDNVNSTLESTTIQGAIDELDEKDVVIEEKINKIEENLTWADYD